MAGDGNFGVARDTGAVLCRTVSPIRESKKTSVRERNGSNPSMFVCRGWMCGPHLILEL
jgi:hypothetical protein